MVTLDMNNLIIKIFIRNKNLFSFLRVKSTELFSRQFVVLSELLQANMCLDSDWVLNERHAIAEINFDHNFLTVTSLLDLSGWNSIAWG